MAGYPLTFSLYHPTPIPRCFALFNMLTGAIIINARKCLAFRLQVFQQAAVNNMPVFFTTAKINLKNFQPLILCEHSNSCTKHSTICGILHGCPQEGYKVQGPESCELYNVSNA